jgi:hypothetical protein
MRDESTRVPGLVVSSMNAGNTTADDRQHSMSAPGSPSVLPVPDRMDNLPLPQPGARADHAHTVGAGGARESRPADTVATRPGQDGGGWRHVR